MRIHLKEGGKPSSKTAGRSDIGEPGSGSHGHRGIVQAFLKKYPAAKAGLDALYNRWSHYEIIPNTVRNNGDGLNFITRSPLAPGVVARTEPIFDGSEFTQTVYQNDSIGSDYSKDLPASLTALTKDKNIVYRGISNPEMKFIKQNGFIKSNDVQNFEAQYGNTFFGEKPDTAEAYAGGFATPRDAAGWTTPSYILAVEKDPTFKKNEVDEWYTPEKIPVSSIKQITEVRLWREHPGDVDFNYDPWRVEGSEGSSTAPVGSYKFKDVTDQFK